MNKTFNLALFLALQTTISFAQSIPFCDPFDTPPADDCANACRVCLLEAYQGNTSGYSPGAAPGFCSTVSNDQWLGFVAHGDTISIEATPSSCQQGDGLELALYTDCSLPPIACSPGQAGDGNQIRSLSAPLVPGQSYFLMVNGYAGDVCDFVILTSPDTAILLPTLGAPGTVQGPGVVAAQSTHTYTIDPTPGATKYRWTGPAGSKINGQTPPVELPAPAGLQVSVTFANEGGSVGAQPSNPCSAGAVALRPVFIGKAPQAPPCPSSNTPAVDNCADACVFCNFSSYTGSNAGYSADSLPDNCIVPNNNLWIGFVASSPAANFTLTASNCANGDGLQMALYYDCTKAPLNCAGGMPGGAGTPLSFDVVLEPGQNYFLMVDGYLSDVCDFTVTVDPPMAQPTPPLPPAGPISGPSNICPGATIVYRIDPVLAAAGYVWSAPPGWLINGSPSPLTSIGAGSNMVTITAGNSAGQLAVFPMNSCNSWNPVTKNIGMQPVPPTLLPPVDVCAEDAPYILPWGNPCSISGTYCATLNSYLGCDSVVCQKVTFKSLIVTNLPSQWICAGDAVLVCGESYSEAGIFSKICESYTGCDSTVNFTLLVQEVIAEIITENPLCAVFPIVLNSAPSPGTKNWKLLTGEVLGAGDSLTVSEPGIYILETTVSGGGVLCMAMDTIAVHAADIPEATATGGVITCSQPSIQLNGSSDRPGVQFSWSGPAGFSSSEEDPVVDLPGTYSLTVTDPQTGCSATDSAIVLADQTLPVLAVLSNVTINCITPSYQLLCPAPFPVNSCKWFGPGIPPGGTSAPVVTIPGTYQLVVTAQNGCTATAELQVLGNFQVPVITAIADTITCANPSVMLNCMVDIPGSVCSWTMVGASYLVVATAPNGCTSTATVQVVVDAAAPSVQLADDTLTCNQTSVTLNCVTNVPGALFKWTGPGGYSSTLQNPTVMQAGNYVVTVTDPKNGCSAVDVATVYTDTSMPLIIITPPGMLNCITDSVTLFATANIPQAQFHWTGPNGFMSNLPSPAVSEPGAYMLTAIVPSTGCMSTAIVIVEQNIQVPELELVQVTNDQNSQGIGAIDISVVFPGAYTVAWYLGNQFFSNSEDLDSLMAGDYEAVVTGANGCTAALQVTVSDTLVSTRALSTDHLWEVFPNPASTSFQLKYRGNQRPEADIWLLDAAGRLVLQKTGLAGGQEFVLSCEQIQTGIYTLLIKTREGLARKLVAVLH